MDIMQVVGATTEREVFVASRTRKFRINEILVIEDQDLGGPQAEVVHTESVNRLVPLSSERNSIVDEKVLEGLRQVGFNIDQEEINVARLRLLEGCPYPIKVGSAVRVPQFAEVERYLVRTTPQNGLTLGVIEGTEEVAAGMPESLQGIAPLLAGQEILPQKGVPMILDFKQMDQYPHIGVFGAPGSGKSVALRVLLEGLMEKRVPGIVADPHWEMLFESGTPGLPERNRTDFTGRYEVYTAGKDVGIAFSDLTDSDLTKLLRAAGGSLSEPMENAAKTLHQEKDTLAAFKERLNLLVTAMEQEVTIRRKLNAGYDDLDVQEREKLERMADILDTYKSSVGHLATLKGLQWRLTRLEREGLFSKDVKSILDALKARKLVVIRGSLWFLQVFVSYAIGKAYGLRRAYREEVQKGEYGGRGKTEKFPPFVVVADEAHVFAPKSLDAPAKSLIREIAQEGRKFGVFLVLATQRPALLDDTTTAMLSTKIIMRTVRSMDISAIREETDLGSEETSRLPYLASGDCFVSSAILGRTFAVRIRAAKTVSPFSQNPFDELDAEEREEDRQIWQALESVLPVSESNLMQAARDVGQRVGRPISNQDLRRLLDTYTVNGRLTASDTMLGMEWAFPAQNG